MPKFQSKNGKNGHLEDIQENWHSVCYRIGGHLPMRHYTVMITLNRGIQTDKGRETRETGSGNEQSESRLALK